MPSSDSATSGGCGVVCRRVCFGHLNQSSECRGIGHGQISEDLAVNLDPRGLETRDEAVVRHAFGPSSSVDPLDPQPAEVAFTRAAVPIGVHQRMSDLLLRLAVHARTLTPVAGCLPEDFTTLFLRIDGALDACHRIYSLCLLACTARLGGPGGRPPC